MPPRFLFDISMVDLNHIEFGPEEIRKYNPHRDNMEHLDAVVWVDTENHKILGYKDLRDDEFWVSGHIPGRPLLPGVLMIEAGAQAACFYIKKYLKWEGFVGFAGVNECRFRAQVLPGQRLYLLAEKVWERHHRICCNLQGIVNGNVAFEAQMVGMQF
jgi:3-hydroxyacyl-[acyl-carrier-protein] dehydratase